MREEINVRFNSHAVSEDQCNKMDRLRQAHMTLALLVNKLAPDCREKSLSLTKLEESMFFVNASISRQNKRDGHIK